MTTRQPQRSVNAPKTAKTIVVADLVNTTIRNNRNSDSNPASNSASNPGSGDASNPGSGNACNPVSGDASNPASGDASKPASNVVSNSAPKSGSNPASNPGFNPASNPGSNSDSNPTSSPASDPVSSDAQFTMAISASLCFRAWYAGLDWVCGGQYREFLTRVVYLVKRLRMLGIEPVFFVDGPMNDQQKFQWLADSEWHWKAHAVVFNDLERQGFLVEKTTEPMPVGLVEMTRFVLSSDQWNVRFITAKTANCDADVVAFATKKANNCLFSVTSLSKTIALDIGGCKVTIHEQAMCKMPTTKGAHQQPKQQQQQQQRLLRKQRGQLRNTIPPSTMQDQSSSWQQTLAMARDRVDQWQLSQFCYQLMTTQTAHIGSDLLEDQRQKEDLPLSGLIYRPLRARIYWFLLKDLLESDSTMKVKEWCGMRDVSTKEPAMMAPLPIQLNDNSEALLALWTDPSQSMSEISMQLLVKAILSGDRKEQVKIEPQRVSEIVAGLKSLPGTLAAPVLTLLYLSSCQPPALTDIEVDSFLMTALLLSQAPRSTKSAHTFISPRAAHVAAVFLSGVQTLTWLNEALGNPVPTKFMQPHLFYDGILFQHLFKKNASSAAKNASSANKNAAYAAKFRNLDLAHRFLAKQLVFYENLKGGGGDAQHMSKCCFFSNKKLLEEYKAVLSLLSGENRQQQDESSSNFTESSHLVGALESARPESKYEFILFRTMLSAKVRSLDVSPHYDAFAGDLITDVCRSMNAAVLRKVLSSIDFVAGTKEKSETGSGRRKASGLKLKPGQTAAAAKRERKYKVKR